MRTPIAHCLSWPDRIDAGVEPLDIFQVARLDFEAPDPGRFRCLGLAQQAWRAGGTASAILNAANEISVEAFLAGDLAFTDIPDITERTLAEVSVAEASSIDVIIDADKVARACARRLITERVPRRMFS